jgi:hypothetical protein
MSFVTGPKAISAVPLAAWFKKDLRDREFCDRVLRDGVLPVFNVVLCFIAVWDYKY